MRVEKLIFGRRLGRPETGGDPVAMIAKWSVLLVSGQEHYFGVLHVELSIEEFYFELATAHCNRAVYRPAPQRAVATLA
jgi:hypothetical protein